MTQISSTKIKHWLAINIIGIIVYICISLLTWPTVEQQDVGLEFRNTDPNELRMFVCFPILVLFTALNLLSVIYVVFHMRCQNIIICLGSWLGIVLLWVGVVKIDRQQFFKESERLHSLRQLEPYNPNHQK